MATIKHRASSARKMESTGYLLRSLTIALPLAGLIGNVAPIVNNGVRSGVVKVQRARNARQLNKWLTEGAPATKKVTITGRTDHRA